MPDDTPAVNQNPPMHKALLFHFTNWGFFAAGIVNLLVGTMSAANNEVPTAATSLTAGLVLLFAATIDRFESLKGLGIEAKTRQLDKKIEQADEALKRIKQVAELSGVTLIDLNSKMGRWDSVPSASASYELAQKVLLIMRSLGSDERTIRQALDPWVRITCRDLAGALMEPLRQKLLERTKELDCERAAIPQPMSPENPVLLRTMAASKEIGSYLENRFNKIYTAKSDAYPEILFELLNDVPAIESETISSVRRKLETFGPLITELKEEFQTSRHGELAKEIESHRAKSQ